MLNQYGQSDELASAVLDKNYKIDQVGGPFYMEVGRNIIINNYNMVQQNGRRLEGSEAAVTEPATVTNSTVVKPASPPAPKINW